MCAYYQPHTCHQVTSLSQQQVTAHRFGRNVAVSCNVDPFRPLHFPLSFSPLPGSSPFSFPFPLLFSPRIAQLTVYLLSIVSFERAERRQLHTRTNMMLFIRILSYPDMWFSVIIQELYFSINLLLLLPSTFHRTLFSTKSKSRTV
jgi:hypothetical protein